MTVNEYIHLQLFFFFPFQTTFPKMDFQILTQMCSPSLSLL